MDAEGNVRRTGKAVEIKEEPEMQMRLGLIRRMEGIMAIIMMSLVNGVLV